MRSATRSVISKGKNYRKEAVRVGRDLARAVWELFPYAPFDAEADRLFDWYFCFEVQGKTLARLMVPGRGASNGAYVNPCQTCTWISSAALPLIALPTLAANAPASKSALGS